MRLSWRNTRCLWPLFLLAATFFSTQTAWARPQIGLALGGGAARGISHIGLLRAFEEEGVPIDLIVGSSMGSIMAGLYASGLSVDNLTYMIQTVDITSLFDPEIPIKGGLLDASRFRLFLDELTDRAVMATAPIPFYTVLTNLETGEEVTLDHGSISQAIQASMAMPVVFPPVAIEGVYYVDGGTKNLVPANVARAVGADIVIAVDLKKNIEVVSHDHLLTNIRLFTQFMFRGYTDAKLPYADYLLLPDVGSESYMDYSAVARLIEAGYVAAKQAMPEIKRIILEKDPDFSFTQPPMPGIPPGEFQRRFARAIERAYKKSSGLVLELKSFGLPGPEYRISAAYRWRSLFPLATGYEFAEIAHPGASHHTLKITLGDDDASSGALFLRRYTTDREWRPGATLQLNLTKTAQVAAEWTAQATPPNQWQVSWRTAFDKGPDRLASIYHLRIGQDPRGLYGEKRDKLYWEAGPEWRIPLTRKSQDVWEIATIYPALFVQGSAYGYIGDAVTSGSFGGWRVETGLDAETRFFGIQSVHSRLSLSYLKQDEGELWSLGLVIGE